MAQIQALACPGDGNVHQAALFFQTTAVTHGVFVGKQAFFQATNEHHIKLQPLAGVYRHHLHRILTSLGLVIAGLQRRMHQEGLQRRESFARLCIRAIQGQVQHRQAGIQALAGRALRQRGTRFINGQRHRILAKTFLRHKAFGRVDQLLQVFNAVLAFFFRAVVVNQAADFQHALNGLAQRLAFGFFSQHIHLGHKALQFGACCTAYSRYCVVQRAPSSTCGFLQRLYAASANTTRREVHHAHKAGVVVWIFNQPQIGQCMLDFSALKKPLTAIHPVRNACVEQLAFNHPTLRIAAVQNGDFLAAVAVVAHQILDLSHDPAGFIQIRGRLHHTHRLARTLIGTQVLAQALAVVLNQRIGAVQNIAVAAVVLLQLDLVLHIKLAHKVAHIANTRTTERIDALVIVAHGQHAAGGLHLAVDKFACQLLEPCVLQLVGVLKLVHQQKPETLLVMGAQRGVIAQQLKTAQHQLAKIHHAFTLALRLVQRVQLYLLFRIWVGHRYVLGAHALFLAASNEPRQLLGRKALVVYTVLLAQAFDRRQLVLRIQNLERGWQACSHVVGTQQTVAQPVEGANPHAAHVVRQHGRQSRRHLLGRLVCKRHGHDAAGRDLPRLQQPCNARGQHPGLARTSACQHQCMALWQRHSSTLFVIQPLQQGRIQRRRRATMGTVKQVDWEHPTIVGSVNHPRHGQVHPGTQRYMSAHIPLIRTCIYQGYASTYRINHRAQVFVVRFFLAAICLPAKKPASRPSAYFEN